jgi:hypothetical protein
MLGGMSTRFHRVIALLSFVSGIFCLLWGLSTSFALIRTTLPDDGTPYFDSPSLREILGIDRISVHWSRLAIAVAGGLVLWILFRIVSKQKYDAA